VKRPTGHSARKHDCVSGRQFPCGLLYTRRALYAALGLGCGDLKVTAAGNQGATIEISNVIFVDRKVHAIEKLIAVRPDRTS
jgi:hypothetical protein